MKKIIYFITLMTIISTSGFAGDQRLTKEEFLDGVDKGTITLEHAPILALPENVLSEVFKIQRKSFPGFKNEMFYAHFIKDNKFIYSLFFEWTTNRCLLRIEEIDPKLGKPNEKTMDPNGQPVEKKYCDKALGIKV